MKVLWVRFPKCRWTNEVLVGFERSKARPFSLKVTEKEVPIPLRDFGDCPEMRDFERDQFLNIWIKHDSEEIIGTIAIIPASKGPILHVGYGKKEKAIARAVLRIGDSSITINGMPPETYLSRSPGKAKRLFWRLRANVDTNMMLENVDVSIEVIGSNPYTIQQPRASAHALASVLIKYNPNWRSILLPYIGAKVKKKPSK